MLLYKLESNGLYKSEIPFEDRNVAQPVLKNLREVSREEYENHYLHGYSPSEMGYTHYVIDKKVITLQFFYFGNLQLGYGYDYRTKKFYLFGCDHEYKELTKEEAQQRGMVHFGNCYHITECVHCGNIRSYDSGD